MSLINNRTLRTVYNSLLNKAMKIQTKSLPVQEDFATGAFNTLGKTINGVGNLAHQFTTSPVGHHVIDMMDKVFHLII